MAQVSPQLRSVENGGHSHYCPGCREIHLIPGTWTFNGNYNSPSFSPSVKISGVKRVIENGEWVGGWQTDSNSNPIPYVCHYFLHAGQLNYCADSTHALAGQTVPLPDLPTNYQDRM